MSSMIPMAAPPGGGPPVDPAALLAMLQQAGAGPGGPPPPDQGPPPPDQGGPGGGADPLAALQAVIQDLHALIAVLPDSGDTKVASQCLAQLTTMQDNLMGAQQQAQTAGQAVAQRLGAGVGA